VQECQCSSGLAQQLNNQLPRQLWLWHWLLLLLLRLLV
jgi:hypothetical protein